MALQVMRRITVRQQLFPGQTIGRAREQRITIDQDKQRHGFAAQAVNDVAVIDEVAARRPIRPWQRPQPQISVRVWPTKQSSRSS